ncbi:MAG: hypothetical protein ACJ763_07225 [Bdellovibrionia bacterium]
MKFETVEKARKSFVPVFAVVVIALTSTSAKAEYIYDAYHSTGVADSKKVLQVRLRPDATGTLADEVEVRTLCREGSELRECADKIVIRKDRLDSVVGLEKAQYQRLLDSFKKDAKTEKYVGGSLGMTGLAMAYPPVAVVAVPLAVLLEGAGIVNHHKANAEQAKKPDPRLETMSASVIQKALSEDVAVSDYRRGDEIEQLRSNLKDLFSGNAQDQEQISKNPAVALGSLKQRDPIRASLDLFEAEASNSGSAL